MGYAQISASWVGRVFYPILGFAVAVLNHVLWDTVGVISNGLFMGLLMGKEALLKMGTTHHLQIPLWVNWLSNLLNTICMNIVAWILVIAGLVKSRRWEIKARSEQLPDEAPAISSDWLPDYPAKASAEIRKRYQLQEKLAKRKCILHLRGKAIDTDVVIMELRDEITTLTPA